jgi:aspartyl-tRNA(Asn)/glutamyl-tRNA(Gln) amidotransferase subunit A
VTAGLRDAGSAGITGLGIRRLSSALAGGTLDAVSLTEHCLARIRHLDGALNAFVWVDEACALDAARQLGRELAAGHRRGPLHGIPIAVKELVDVAGAPSEYGSLARQGCVADIDAEVVTRLRRAGAVIIGTTRSHEFGWGITTQHAGRGGTRNPLALDRVPGGSSGGAAAAVAAGMVPACIATDTGGSIRIPSAFCGVAGIKPTFGRVVRAGVAPLAPSFDTLGVITRYVEDLWLVLDEIAGRFRGDSWGAASSLPPSGAPVMLRTLSGVRIGYAPALLSQTTRTPRLVQYEEALQTARRLGAEVLELAVPPAEEMREVFGVLQGCEAVDTHRRVLGLYPSRADLYGVDVRERLDNASSLGLADYLAASRRREQLSAALVSAIRGVDVLLTPVSTVAPPFVDRPDVATFGTHETDLRTAVMGFTVPQNLAGLPTVTFPAGASDDGLPCGLQLTADAGCEATALSVASLLSRELVDSHVL